VVSGSKDIPVPEKTIVFGEVGLSGEVRAVSMVQQRVQEARKLGFERVVLPQSSLEQAKNIRGIELVGVSTVRDALKVIS